MTTSSDAVAGQLVRGVRRTFGELCQPMNGSLVEFWCGGTQQGRPGTGIRGWFREMLFWSLDDADHYAPGEVTMWHTLRSPMQCQASGCDGCRVCAPNVNSTADPAA